MYNSIMKSYSNQALTPNTKIKKCKIQAVESMVQMQGINNKEGVPLGAVDFVCKVAEESNDELRKIATSILKLMKSKGAANEVVESVRFKGNLKGSIIRELTA
jgi:hypothetical protein